METKSSWENLEDPALCQPSDVLNWWFSLTMFQQFITSVEVDDYIKHNFSKAREMIGSGELKWPQDNADSLLAEIIIIDQFSRNLFRGDSKSFDQDAKCRELVHKAIDLGFFDVWEKLSTSHIMFAIMPLMHSEDIADHNLAYEKFKARFSEGYAILWKNFGEHSEVIKKFGRYPWRNPKVGREHTAEEVEYMKNPLMR